MALQAQYPSNTFSPDFGGRGRNDFVEDLKMLRERDHQIGSLVGAYNPLGQRICNNTTASSDPQSQLTCNAAAASRKRSRGDLTTTDAGISTGVSQHLQEHSRMFRSAGASTSGRPAAVSGPSPVVPPFAQDLVSFLNHQSIEIDAVIRLQTERLRSGLEEATKRHCRSLLAVLEQQVVVRIREKETELESVIRRNAELEERLTQVSAENNIWFNAAVNSEAIVSSLRTNMELLLQSTAAAVPPAKEGFGESDGCPFPADDAQSCYVEQATTAVALQRESEKLRCLRGCRVCSEEEACVLLLPCRHLCVCKECEPTIDTCPICHSSKNASLQIFMS